MLDNISIDSAGLKTAAVVISYIVAMIQRLASIFKFATGVDPKLD